MGDRFSTLSPDLAQWWSEQPLFFVATAPSGDGGHVNLSPKGLDTLRALLEAVQRGFPGESAVGIGPALSTSSTPSGY